MKAGDSALASVRIDVWLWAARFFKTRALAKQAIEAGRVEIDGQTCKPARPVRCGDRLDVQRLDEKFAIEVLELSSVRGPASRAQRLYRESEESIARRAEEREQKKLANAGFQPPKGKPDKRARRLIQALGDYDAL